MEVHDFFDKLYQMWSKTTYAKDRYWDYQDDDKSLGLFKIGAVGEDGERAEVAWGLYEADADFITALHGCFPDLYRALNNALDEADRADFSRDSRECRIAELETELAELRDVYEKELRWRER